LAQRTELGAWLRELLPSVCVPAWPECIMGADPAASRAPGAPRARTSMPRMLRDETDSQGQARESDSVDISVRAAAVRRALSQNDPPSILQAMRPLAARSEYSSRALARALGISTRQLQRIFARWIGSPPQEWLNEQRLLVARDLLCRTCSVKEVAFALGFRTVSQLSRDFKRRFGVTPKAMIDAQSRADA
jgi:AraC-like DNA-binding protein